LSIVAELCTKNVAPAAAGMAGVVAKMLQRKILQLKDDKSCFSSPENTDTLDNIALRHNLC
jgi:hypothetical protein